MSCGACVVPLRSSGIRHAIQVRVSLSRPWHCFTLAQTWRARSTVRAARFRAAQHVQPHFQLLAHGRSRFRFGTCFQQFLPQVFTLAL